MVVQVDALEVAADVHATHDVAPGIGWNLESDSMTHKKKKNDDGDSFTNLNSWSNFGFSLWFQFTQTWLTLSLLRISTTCIDSTSLQ